MHAARAIEETQAAAFPDHDIADWLVIAKRVMVLGSNGRVVFDYDMKIAEPFASAEGAGQVDMWPGLAALAGKPVLLLRGELSDVLSVTTLEGMAERLPQAEVVTIANVGHAPSLDEPESRAAIDRLLARAE
jgi:pimeloyl-ACP methyl ester carboxylesterase